jgi:hypothetical protein
MDRHDHPETGGATPANGQEPVQPVAADSDPVLAAVDTAAEASTDGDTAEPPTEAEPVREPVHGTDHYRPL